MRTTKFTRAIFLSWYCSNQDCKFCYLSTQKNQNPHKARRSLSSILSEAVICKECNWDVEFLSAGTNTFSDKELLNIIKNIYKVTGEKQWLNLGVLTKKQLELFQPYLEGVCGTVECIREPLRDELCPSKPLEPIIDMFKAAEEMSLKKAITIIIGLGEKREDIPKLLNFIKRHRVDRITFYRLKPQKGTIFENSEGPKSKEYVEWVKKTREAFPDIEIIVGSWLGHLDEIHQLLNAGADMITKFPATKKFGSKYAEKIEEEAEKAGRNFLGTLTKLPDIDTNQIDELEIPRKEKVKKKLKQYIKRMKDSRT